MVRRYYDLPSLTALAVFEASARHLSFKLAAAELNVTPGAVSKQIKAIEDELGMPLFVRLGAGVSLTSAGEDLYGVLSSSFSRAAEVVRTIKRGDRFKNVTIACTDAFATMWLIPRMGDFWERFPEITVDHLISDNPRDYRRAEVELRVRYGLGAWADESAELLFDETIYPVCGPGFASTHRDAVEAFCHGAQVNSGSELLSGAASLESNKQFSPWIRFSYEPQLGFRFAPKLFGFFRRRVHLKRKGLSGIQNLNQKRESTVMERSSAHQPASAVLHQPMKVFTCQRPIHDHASLIAPIANFP